MGQRVLTASSTDTQLRAYAHCTQNNSTAVTVALLNFAAESATVSFSLAGAGGSVSRSEYILSSDALTSTAMYLNGERLVADTAGSLPPLVGHDVADSSATPLVLPAHSYAFVVLHVALSVCA